MPLSPRDRERLGDIVELQPTKNRELQEAWGMESGSDVHQYLESALRSYYYRDENSLIRATAEAEAIVSGESVPDTLTVELTSLERAVFDAVPGPAERSLSVVSVLHRIQERQDIEPSVEEVRRVLRTLERRGVLERISRTVPTYRLARSRSDVEVRSVETA